MGRPSKQVDRTCRNCFTVFKFKPSQLKVYVGAGKYCSRDCSYKHRAALNKNRPSTDKYGRTNRVADIEWRTAVKERDKNTCQRCGIINDVMHAHHKATRGAHPELKHDVDNGVTLCGSCHQWVHRNPKEATEQGLMAASKYDIVTEDMRRAKIVASSRKRSLG